MKRTGLVRKTPLSRGGSAAPTIPAEPPAKRSTLRPVSKKRQAVNRERTVRQNEMREEQPWCTRCGRTDFWLDGHELDGRTHGADITRPDMLLCRPCNGWIEDEPVIAAWQGWKNSAKNSTAPCIAAGLCARGAHGVGEFCEVAA